MAAIRLMPIKMPWVISFFMGKGPACGRPDGNGPRETRGKDTKPQALACWSRLVGHADGHTLERRDEGRDLFKRRRNRHHKACLAQTL